MGCDKGFAECESWPLRTRLYRIPERITQRVRDIELVFKTTPNNGKPCYTIGSFQVKCQLAAAIGEMSPNTLLCELSRLQETEIENMSLRRFNMIIL